MGEGKNNTKKNDEMSYTNAVIVSVSEDESDTPNEDDWEELISVAKYENNMDRYIKTLLFNTNFSLESINNNNWELKKKKLYQQDKKRKQKEK